jgi:MOSC domain-containing protein YiiM
MAASAGKVLSVNVGAVRAFEYDGRPAKSAIWKAPIVGRIAARGLNLVGDDQADRRAHGGPDKAIYAYAVEDVRRWEKEIGRALAYGEFGENLTTEGIEVNDALIGEHWEIGTAVLEVSEPRIPCWRLGVRMNDHLFPRRFTMALRPGTYLRIVVEGGIWAPEIRSGSSRDRSMISRSEMYFASIPAIAMRPSAYLRFPGCRRAGGGGRAKCCKRPKPAARMRASPDAARRGFKSRWDCQDACVGSWSRLPCENGVSRSQYRPRTHADME